MSESIKSLVTTRRSDVVPLPAAWNTAVAASPNGTAMKNTQKILKNCVSCVDKFPLFEEYENNHAIFGAKTYINTDKRIDIINPNFTA